MEGSLTFIETPDDYGLPGEKNEYGSWPKRCEHGVFPWMTASPASATSKRSPSKEHSMADNYLQFSERLDLATSAEADWLRRQLEEDPETGRPHFLLDFPDPEEADSCGFEYEFDEDPEDRHLWIYAVESGTVEHVAHLVQTFLKRFRPGQCWSLTYATTCSQLRVSEFGGGAVFVTADEIHWQNAYDFVEQERAKFEQSKKPTPGKTEHGETTAIEP